MKVSRSIKCIQLQCTYDKFKDAHALYIPNSTGISENAKFTWNFNLSIDLYSYSRSEQTNQVIQFGTFDNQQNSLVWARPTCIGLATLKNRRVQFWKGGIRN